MALTDTFVKQLNHTGKPTGDKQTDGGGMYLLVKASGKCWRMDDSHADKRKTLVLGVYLEVSLIKARQRRDKARELLADCIDRKTAKQDEKQGDQGVLWFLCKKIATFVLGASMPRSKWQRNSPSSENTVFSCSVRSAHESI